MDQRTENVSETGLHFTTQNKIHRKSEEGIQIMDSCYAFDTDGASNQSHPEQFAA